MYNGLRIGLIHRPRQMFAKRFSLVLALVLAVYAGAALVLHSWFPRDENVEAFLCRFYLCDNDLLIESAYQDLWGSGPTAAADSIPEFEESLRRNPASPFRWCDLGDALLRAGEVDRSRYYYEQAVKLGPESPAVLLRAAHFHAQAGEPNSAPPLLARILDGTRRYDDVVFSYYDRMGIGVADVLARGLPENRSAAQSYFRYLLRRGEAAELGRAWEWLISRSLAEESQLSGYVDFLLRARQYETARRTS